MRLTRFSSVILAFLVSHAFASNEVILTTVPSPTAPAPPPLPPEPHPIFLLKGNYETPLLREGEETSNQLKMSVSAAGEVSGFIKTETKRLRFRGTLDKNGSFFAKLPAGPEDTTSFTISSTEINGRWRIVLEGAAYVWGVFHPFRPTAPFGLPAGAYPQRVTMLLQETGLNGFPDEQGFAVGKLNATGKLRLTGRLPGNQPFAASAAMKRDGGFTLDVNRHGLRGTFALTEQNDGIFCWESQLTNGPSNPPPQDAGTDGSYPLIEATRTMEAHIGTYIPEKVRPFLDPESSTSYLVVRSFMGYQYLGHGTISANLHCAIESDHTPMRLQIDQATGRMRGSYLDMEDGRRWRTLSGAVFLPSKIASGLIVNGRNMSGGSFEFYPLDIEIDYQGE